MYPDNLAVLVVGEAQDGAVTTVDEKAKRVRFILILYSDIGRSLDSTGVNMI